MDAETVKYIIRYYGDLMTDEEKLALRHQMYMYHTEDNPQQRKVLVNKGILTEQATGDKFSNMGSEEFEMQVANRIMQETPGKVNLNNCPKCHKLARTPYSRQCRHCGYQWHNLLAAQFSIEDCFQLTENHFYVVGHIMQGTVNIGQYMDLTPLEIVCKPQIYAIDVSTKIEVVPNTKTVALFINELSEAEKALLKSNCRKVAWVEIVRER